jgi:hypothetical protein
MQTGNNLITAKNRIKLHENLSAVKIHEIYEKIAVNITISSEKTRDN